MKLVWSGPARADVESIRDYIRRDSEFYAGRFVGRVIETAESLVQLPARGRLPQVQRILQLLVDCQLCLATAVSMADTGTFQRYLLSGHHRPATLTTMSRHRPLPGSVLIALSAELLHLGFQQSDRNQSADLDRQVVEPILQ